jgi:protein gp37
MARRFGEVKGKRRFGTWGPDGIRLVATAKKRTELHRLNDWYDRRHNILRPRVFINPMADVFEEHDELNAIRTRLWRHLEGTRYLDHLLLTKRAENIEHMVPEHWLRPSRSWNCGWPDNVWLGVSVENQEVADDQIPRLLKIPAAIRWLSLEPLLGPVDLSPWIGQLNWVIVGGETGPGARPMNPEWARSLRDQCVEANIPFWFKGHGSNKATPAGEELDGKTWRQVAFGRNSDADQKTEKRS